MSLRRFLFVSLLFSLPTIVGAQSKTARRLGESRDVSGEISSLAPAQTREIGDSLGIDLTQPAVIDALDRVMQDVPESDETLPSAIERGADRYAQDVHARLESLAAGAVPAKQDVELEADLNALHEIRAALRPEVRDRIATDLAVLRSGRVQQAIEAALAEWAPRTVDGVLASAPHNVESPSNRLPGLLPAPKEHVVEGMEAAGITATPNMQRVPAPIEATHETVPGRAFQLWMAARQRVIKLVYSRDVSAPVAPSESRPLSRDVSLSRLIGGLRSLASLPADQAAAYRSRYSSWFENPTALSEMLNAIEARESIKEARLDTLIHHQAGEKDDAIVELVNNGVDTLLERAGLKYLVGRFGVGAFQMLQELEKPGDQVVLETSVEDGKARRIVFSLSGVPDPDRPTDAIQIRFETVHDASLKRGTVVRVIKASGLSSKRQKSLRAKIASRLDQSARVELRVNGKRVNVLDGWKDIEGRSRGLLAPGAVEVTIDGGGYQVRDPGLGMSDELLLEKYLIPRRSTKSERYQSAAAEPAPSELYYQGDPNGKPGELTKMHVTLAVAGVKVEEFEVEGLRVPEQMILELPPGTWVPESRNKIDVDDSVWDGLRALSDRILQGDLEHNIGLLNAVAAIGRYFENPRTHPESADGGENFKRYLNERMDQVPGLRKIPEFESEGRRAYTMRFKDRETVFMEYGRNLIFDEEVYQRYKDYPLLLNLAMNFYIGYGDQKPSKGEFLMPEQAAVQSVFPEARRREDSRILSARKALEAHEWFKRSNRRVQLGVLDYFRRRLSDTPPAERDALLESMVKNLEPLGAFAQSFMPGLDWTRSVSAAQKPEEPKLVNPNFDIIDDPFWIGSDLVYHGRRDGRDFVSRGDHRSPDDDFDRISHFQNADGHVLFAGLKAGVWRVYLDGAVVWESATQHVAGVARLDDGSVAVLVPEGSGYAVFVSGKKVWSQTFEQLPRNALFRSAGNRWVFVLGEGSGEKSIAHILLDGHEVWSGPFNNIGGFEVRDEGPSPERYPVVAGGRFIFAAYEDRAWRIYVDGKPQPGRFGSVEKFKAVGDSYAFVGRNETSEGYVETLYLENSSVWDGEPSGYVADYVFVQGEPAVVSYSWSSGRDNRALFFRGKRRSFGKDYVNVFNLDGELGYVHCNNGGCEAYRGDELVWMKLNDRNGLELQALGHKTIIADRWRELYIDGELVAHGNVSDVTVGSNGIVYSEDYGGPDSSHTEFFMLAQKRDLTQPKTEAFELEPARLFAQKHAYNLQDGEQLWGERYVRNLLSGWGEVPLEQAQPLMPFLEADLLRTLSPENIHTFGALAAGEKSWAKLDEVAEFMRRTRPLTKDDAEWNRWAGRWLSIVRADWRRAKVLLGELGRNYGPKETDDSKVLGFDFLKDEADPRQAPGHLRGFLQYLRAKRTEELEDRPAVNARRGRLLDSIKGLPLAYLTLARRQRSRQIADSALTFSGYIKLLKDFARRYSTQAMDEEIASAIRGQDKNGMFWIRELVQNSRDALRRAWKEGVLPKGEGQVVVDSYKSGGRWIVSVKDPVGMSLAKLANYFFPLDESDKIAGRDAGHFGQGLYMLFGDFDEVSIKTGVGDGNVYDIRIARGPDGRLWIKSWEQRAEVYRGTEIQRIKNLDGPGQLPSELEAAFVTQAVFEYTGVVQDVPIVYRGERVNEALSEVQSVEVEPWGTLRVYKSPSRLPRITQDGLSIAEPGLQAELFASMPEWMQGIWRRRGLILELPAELPLARSRSGLAQKDKTREVLVSSMFAVTTRMLAKLYIEDSEKIVGLPEDFYYWPSYEIRFRSRLDAKRLNAGNWAAIDWDYYSSNPQALAQLLALTKTRVGDEVLSPWDIRQRILAKQAPPQALGISDEVRNVWEFASNRVAQTPSIDIKLGGPSLTPELRDFRNVNLAILRQMGEKGWNVGFYDKDDGSLAHAPRIGWGIPGIATMTVPLKSLSWNLHATETTDLVEKWQGILAGDDDYYDFFYDLLETEIHEYTHYTDGDWTHESDETMPGSFAWRMRRNLEKLIRSRLDLKEFVERQRRLATSPARANRS